MGMTLRLPALGFLAFALAAACGDSTVAPPGASLPTGPSEPPPLTTTYPSPGGTWQTIDPATIGWDSTALRNALDWAGGQRSTAVVILWRGRIVAERYWQGWTPATDSIIASAGKSVLSTLVGQLAATGRLSLEDPVSRWLGAGWSRAPATEPRITVRDLLAMASGLNDSLQAVAPPASRFYYNNPAYYQLFQVVQRASGQEINAASRTLLFDAIGMTSRWRLSFDTGEPGFILSATARDMARFGLLALSKGRWDGSAVLRDSAWFEQAWRASTPDNAGYGYLWWLNGSASYRTPGPYLLPAVQSMLIPSAPRDLKAALGKGDKKIYVVPSLDVVVVRHGQEADAAGGNPLAISAFDEQWWQRLRVAMRY